MNRQSIGNGKWYDRDSSFAYPQSESTILKDRFDRDMRSELIRTRKDHWILHKWTDSRDPRDDSWEILSESESCKWLVDNALFDYAQSMLPGWLNNMEV